MTMSDRGVHPDLLEEVSAAAEQDQAPAPEAAPREPRTRTSRGGRGSRQSAASASTPGVVRDAAGPEGEADSSGPPAAESPDGQSTPPDWFQSVRESADPQAALATILKNIPYDELNKHPQIQGWVGDMAKRVARERAAQQEFETAQREKAEAWRRGDLYRLGELYSPEEQQRAVQAQQAQATEPFMQSVTEFQKGLPVEVQQEIQGKQYASMADYLSAVHQAHLKHDIETEIKRRQPALDKAELSATVGSEPSPERNGGPSPGVREITDAEIERMSLAEYERYFDENGHARNGVRVRLTRGVDVTRR